MKLIIRNSNGDITEQEITENMHFSPSVGEQYFVTGVENYTFDLVDNNSSLSVHFLDNSGERVHLVLEGMADLLSQNDPSNPFSMDTSFGVSTNEAGNRAIEDALNNKELENGEIVEALQDALSMDGSTLAAGAIIDDLQALLDKLDAAATGEVQSTAYNFLEDRDNQEESQTAQDAGDERPDNPDEIDSSIQRSSGDADYGSAENINHNPTVEAQSTATVNEDGTTSITYSASDIEGAVEVTASAEHGTVTVNDDGTITYTPDENYNGADTITVTATDSEGATTSTTSAVTVTSDGLELAPTSDLAASSDTGVSDSDNITSDNTPTITGTTEAGASVSISLGGVVVGTAIADENGEYSITTSELPDGEQDLTITATDGAGNTSSTTETVTIDTTASDMGELAITNIVDNSGDYSSVTMEGTGAEVGNTITIYDEDDNAVATTQVAQDGSWNVDISNLSATGVNDNEFFKVSETDTAGNETAQTDSVHYWHGSWAGIITEDSDDFVIAGSGDDTIFHDTADSRWATVNGEDSNDRTVIDGGDGTDTVRLSGNYTDYTITVGEDGHLLVTEGASSDSDGDGIGDVTELRNIETIEFADGTYDVAAGTFIQDDLKADEVSLSIEVGEETVNETTREVVDEAANANDGIYEKDGNFYTKDLQEVDTGVVDTAALREQGYTIDSDGNIYEIDDDAPKQLVEQQFEREVTKVVEAEPIMKEATETTTIETLGEAHIDEGAVIARKSGVDFDFDEPTSNIELDFNNFNTGTAKISFYDSEGNQVGDTINTSHTNGAEDYVVPEGAVGVSVYNNTHSNNFEVESISYRGEPQTVTVEAGGLVPDYEAMEAAGYTYSDTQSITLTQSEDITRIGNVGNNQVDGFNPEDSATSQVFDFGSELANQKVTITIDMEVKGSWDNNTTSTNDYFSISANGQEVDVHHYSNRSWGHETDDVEVINSRGTDQEYQYEVYLDENGQVQLEFMVASTATDEIVNIENIEVAYEGVTGWMKEVTETEIFTESVLVDAPAVQIDPSDIPGGVPTIFETREVEVEAEPHMTTVSEVESVEYPINLAAQLTDTDGSESLSDITVDNLPEGATLTGDNVTDNEDGTYSVAIDENGEANATLQSTSELSQDELGNITAFVTSTEESTGDTSTISMSEDGELSFLDDVDAVDFTEVSTNLQDIHEINMANETSQELTLDADDIVNSNEEDELVILGDDGDVVNLEGEGWSKEENVSVEGEEGTFDKYSSVSSDGSTVDLYVDNDMTVNTDDIF